MRCGSVKFSTFHGILKWAAPLFKTLMEIYKGLPEMSCRRRAKCCSLAPQLYYLEFLHIMAHLAAIERNEAIEFMRKIAVSFFLNAWKILPCPFLQGRDCLIYPIRPFA